MLIYNKGMEELLGTIISVCFRKADNYNENFMQQFYLENTRFRKELIQKRRSCI